jgi:Asp-tRNA(Asn)/Glu-tRNA(Gln) amidotransferase A subunit family amidase
VTEPCDLCAIEARRLIGTKRLSPVELLESCIGRIEAVDHAVNAVTARDFDRARQTAKRAEQAVMGGERLPALHGLPIAIKDLEDAEGLVNSQGSPIYRDDIRPRDQRSVAAVRAAGGIIVGKSNVPEFGAGANSRNRVYGATGNPFDPTKNAAGSSGGSGVALACGMVPLATGSDTGGSLRNPAAFNGIVGFRPTPGLVASERGQFGWSALSVLGPMARTVPDAALLLSVMASDDKRDPLATTIHGRSVRRPEDFYPLPEVDLASLRVALTPDFGQAPTERHIAEVFAEKTGLFRDLFARAEDAHPDCTGADESFEVLRSLGYPTKHGEHMRTRPDDLGPNIHANYEEALRYSAVDVSRALKAQTEHYRRWQTFYDGYDLILSPAITTSPRPWTELFPAEIDGKKTRTYFHWLALAYYPTLAGHPALSLPVGLDRNGMPFGLQIVGPRGGDAFVLAAAAALERALAGDARTRRPVPDLAKLRAAPAIREMPGFLELG